MAWSTAPGEEIQPPENVAEERIRQIVREELAILAAKTMNGVLPDGS